LRGHGCTAPGAAKIIFRAGACVLAVARATSPAAGHGPLPTVVRAEAGARTAYALEGGVYATASAVNWTRGPGLVSRFDEISAVDAPPASSRGPSRVPALSGLGCRHRDRSAKGAWPGMTLDTGPRDPVQAVLEGVAVRTGEVPDAIGALQPVAGPVSIDGGMTRSARFCAVLADTTGRPLTVSDQPELTALGMADLAAAGAGISPGHRRGGRTVAPRSQPPEWAARFAVARRKVRDNGETALC
jgi:glycerol kinase